MAVNAPISIRDVAAHAGVSVGTVSNAMNRPDIVAASTRDRVHASIKALGFVRNESARQLRAGRSRMIGLIVLDVANPFFTDVARGVEDEVSKSGLAVILCNSDDQLPRENGYLDLLEENRVQGILITPVADDRHRLAELQARGTPVILVDSRSPAGGQCSVSVDDVLGGDIAVTHLLETGHERIAFAGGPVSLRQVADRREGALRALARVGAGPAELMGFETPALNVAAGKAAGSAIADTRPPDRPTAVFCANDLVAFGLLQEMTERKIRVPTDIAIVGYDDIDFAAAAAVPLSSVRQPRQLIGRTAAQLLLEEAMAQDDHQHRQVIFEPELEIRRSSQHGPGSRARRRRGTVRAITPTGPRLTAAAHARRAADKRHAVLLTTCLADESNKSLTLLA
jgi:LacI family transcriptional regulator